MLNPKSTNQNLKWQHLSRLRCYASIPCGVRSGAIRVFGNFAKTRRNESERFFAELKRRNVYTVAIAYALIAWLRNALQER